MPRTSARFQAQPEDVMHVRQALEQMVHDARQEDPVLLEYVLYEFEDTPGEFLIEQHVSAVEEELKDLAEERLMELGTALREELNGPIYISHYRLVADSRL